MKKIFVSLLLSVIGLTAVGQEYVPPVEEDVRENIAAW